MNEIGVRVKDDRWGASRTPTGSGEERSLFESPFHSVLGGSMGAGELRSQIEPALDLLMHRFMLFRLSRMRELGVDQDIPHDVEQRWLLDRQGAEQRIHDALLGEKARVLGKILGGLGHEISSVLDLSAAQFTGRSMAQFEREISSEARAFAKARTAKETSSIAG
jgi:hypothetical protein